MRAPLKTWLAAKTITALHAAVAECDALEMVADHGPFVNTVYSTCGNSRLLESVAAVSTSGVWAVGPEGTILHYNGATWSVVNGPS